MSCPTDNGGSSWWKVARDMEDSLKREGFWASWWKVSVSEGLGQGYGTGYTLDINEQIMALVQEYTQLLMSPGGGDVERRKDLAIQLKALEDQRAASQQHQQMVAKKGTWWKVADPRFEQNEQGKYDLKFDPGEEDWMHSDFRVGDRVQLRDSGRFGYIEEVNGDEVTVHLEDTGEKVPQNIQNLTPAPGPPQPEPSHEDLQRFEGGDPEHQDFEDPTFVGDYITGEELDDQTPELIPGDVVHVFNPYEANEDFIDAEGTVREVQGDHYIVDTGQGTGGFAREELELWARPSTNRLASFWWKVAMPPIREPWESIAPGQKSVPAVPWGATEDPEGGGYTLTTPDRDPKKKMRPKDAAPPTLPMKDVQQRGVTPETMVENIKRAYRCATADQLREGVGWYDSARQKAQKLVDQFGEATGITLDQVVGLQSAISPKLSWEQNERYPALIIQQYMIEGIDLLHWRDSELNEFGEHKKLSVMNTNRSKAVAIMDGQPLDEIFKSLKTRNFLHNILGSDQNVTVDVWAMRVALGETMPRSNIVNPLTGEFVSYGGPADPVYKMMHDAYVEAARQITEEGDPISPRDLQAVTWGVYRDIGSGANLPDMTIDDIEHYYGVSPSSRVDQTAVASWWSRVSSPWWSLDARPA